MSRFSCVFGLSVFLAAPSSLAGVAASSDDAFGGAARVPDSIPSSTVTREATDLSRAAFVEASQAVLTARPQTADLSLTVQRMDLLVDVRGFEPSAASSLVAADLPPAFTLSADSSDQPLFGAARPGAEPIMAAASFGLVAAPMSLAHQRTSLSPASSLLRTLLGAPNPVNAGALALAGAAAGLVILRRARTMLA